MAYNVYALTKPAAYDRLLAFEDITVLKSSLGSLHRKAGFPSGEVKGAPFAAVLQTA